MTESPRRVFFALMPPPAVAQQIATLADRLDLDGRAVAADRIHLTLLFCGNVDAQGIETCRRAAGELAVSRFTLRLDRIGYFARPGIAWLGPPRLPEALTTLHEKLHKNTVRSIDKYNFRPHVTLARRASAVTARETTPIDWPVTDFSLVASGENGAPGAYRELVRWPLI